MILHDNFLYLSIRIDVWKLLFHRFSECVLHVTKDDVRIAWDRKRSGSLDIRSQYWLQNYV